MWKVDIDYISECTFKRILKHLGEEKQYNTYNLVMEAGYDSRKIDSEDLMRIDYNVRKMAEKEGIELDDHYADGLFIGDKYNTPYLIKREKITNENKAIFEICKKYPNMIPISWLRKDDSLYLMMKEPNSITLDGMFVVRYFNNEIESKYAIESVLDWKINLNEGWNSLNDNSKL